MSNSAYRLSDQEVVAPRLTMPVFAAMASGLTAGVIAAAAIVTALVVIASIPSGQIVAGFFAALLMSSLILPTGLALAIIPIGPLWVAIAWILVRCDTRSVWAYTAAGAAAATGLPLLLPTWTLAIATEGSLGWLGFFVWFAASGAIGRALTGVRIGALLDAPGASSG